MAGGSARQPGQAGATGVSEINLVEEQIDEVIKQIEAEQDELLPVAFAFGGLVSDGSFGAADSAPNLALHYSKAHEVTWKTLLGVKKDLLDFQEACRLAKEEILTADQNAHDQLRAVTSAVEILGTDNVGANSRQARDDARNGEAGGDS